MMNDGVTRETDTCTRAEIKYHNPSACVPRVNNTEHANTLQCVVNSVHE